MSATLRQQEPSLLELLQEPMVRQLMRCDRVTSAQMQQTLRRAGFRSDDLSDFLDDSLARAS